MHDYLLDPEGDVTLTLTNGNASAAWDPTERGEASSGHVIASEGSVTMVGSSLPGLVTEHTLLVEQA